MSNRRPAVSNLLWTTLPYIAFTSFALGHFWRYRNDQFGWTTRSSQLYENRLLRLGSPLFHDREATTAIELYIGGEGASFPVLHYDGMHTHAFLMQLYGTKEYVAFAPQQSVPPDDVSAHAVCSPTARRRPNAISWPGLVESQPSSIARPTSGTRRRHQGRAHCPQRPRA